MRRTPIRLAILAGITPLLAGSLILPRPAKAQQPAQGQSSPTKSVQHRPVTLEHCYWHFLMYQNHLDSKGAERMAQGQDGRSFSGQLQATLAFPDADFAPIRASSARLAAEVNALNGKAAAIVAAKSPTSSVQLQALTMEREADINAEVAYLRKALGPAKTAAFEAFIVQMFAPKTVAVQVPVGSSQSTPAAVQP